MMRRIRDFIEYDRESYHGEHDRDHERRDGRTNPRIHVCLSRLLSRKMLPNISQITVV